MPEAFKKFDFSFNQERSILLICIGVSFLIWIFLKLSKDYETSRSISVEYKLPAMMEFTNEPPNSIRATMSGVGIDLAKKYLLARRPTITLDLVEYPNHEIERSEILFKIQEELKLNVLDIDLNYIRFYIDSTATKKVPIVLNLEINFRKDYFLKQPISLSTDSVTLAGPQQELVNIEAVQTEFATCPSLFKSEQRTLKINTAGIKNIEIHPSEIEVNIEVEQFTEKTLTIPIKVVNAIDSVQVLPSSVQLTCAVGISNFDTLTDNDFEVEADIGAVIKLGDQKSVPVTLTSSPYWAKSPRINPKVVDFLIIK